MAATHVRRVFPMYPVTICLAPYRFSEFKPLFYRARIWEDPDKGSPGISRFLPYTYLNVPHVLRHFIVTDGHSGNANSYASTVGLFGGVFCAFRDY